MKKILPVIFLISGFTFAQQEIPFSNKKDELVKVISYMDGSFSIVTSNSVNWGKTTSRFYSADNKLIREVSLPAKVGVSCTINGFNNLRFPEMTAYHPELKLTLMLGGISGPILPPQMVCRILNEEGQIKDLALDHFKETNHALITCEVHKNNLMVIYSSTHELRKNEFWLAVIDLEKKVVREEEIVSGSEGIGSYIGFREGRFYFLSNKDNSTTLNTVNSEAKLEQVPIDFPEDLFSRQKFAMEANRVIEAIHPVKYYADQPDGEICFMLYGRESFICKIPFDNEVLYQPVLIPDSMKIVGPLINTGGIFDFRKAIIVDTKEGSELLISNNSKNIDSGPCSLGRWKIQWDYAEVSEAIEILGGIMLGSPLDMIAYSGKNPYYEEWKESYSQTNVGVSLLRTREDFQGAFSFIEFSNPIGKPLVKAILFTPK